MVKEFKKPKAGRRAWHVDGLDPRTVAEVSEDGRFIKLDILGYITGWIPVENYSHFTEAS